MKRRSFCPLVVGLSLLMLVSGASAQTTGGTYIRYIPHLAGPPAWISLLQVHNPASQTASFNLSLFSQGTAVYSNVLTIAPLSSQTIVLNDLAPGATNGILTGSGSVPYLLLDYFNLSGGGIAEYALPDTPASEIALSFGSSAASITWKGIAVMNAGAAPDTVTLYAIGGGAVLGTASATVPPRQRITGTSTRWFPSVLASQIELIMVVGQHDDLAGVAISGTADNSQMICNAAFPVSGIFPPPAPDGSCVVFAWNDLGMHCLNPTYDTAVILPPYNTVWAQVIRKGNPPQVVTEGLTVDYRILNNTYSYGKASYGQFWDYCQALFGASLAPDTGLNLKNPELHNRLAGTMVSMGDHFEAVGIPITPITDTMAYDPYQIAEITVKDASGTLLAQTQATVPTSDQINCARCHGPDPFQDMLVKHPLVNGTSLAANTPVLCASCHASPALGSTPGDRGSAGTYLSEAIHGFHADKATACYDCHPGTTTKCNRSIAHTSGDGNCVTCHGTMQQMYQQIASNNKVPWVTEPQCLTCHAAAGVDTGTQLYRDSAGHGGVSCPACHQSPHAMVPSREASDNYQALQYQGAALSISSCGVCHQNSKGPAGEMGEFAEVHGGLNPEHKNACHVCHTAVSANTASWPHSFTWKAR